MITRKEALMAVGGFDSTFNFGYEDVDLGWRMVIAGYRLLFVPTVHVLHKGGRSTDPDRSDEMSLIMGLVNYHIMNLKVASHIWPYIVVQFYRMLLDYEIWKLRNMKDGFGDSIKSFLTANVLFFQRLKSVQRYRMVLSTKFRFKGKRKLEEFARGKRFIPARVTVNIQKAARV